MSKTMSKALKVLTIVSILFVSVLAGIYAIYSLFFAKFQKPEVKEERTYKTVKLESIDESKVAIYDSDCVTLTFNYLDVIEYLEEGSVDNPSMLNLKQYIEEQGIISDRIELNTVPIYLIGELVERKNVKIYDKASNQFVQEVEVEEVNVHCGPLCGSGHKYYRTKPDNNLFLSVMLWIS